MDLIEFPRPQKTITGNIKLSVRDWNVIVTTISRLASEISSLKDNQRLLRKEIRHNVYGDEWRMNDKPPYHIKNNEKIIRTTSGDGLTKQEATLIKEALNNQ